MLSRGTSEILATEHFCVCHTNCSVFAERACSYSSTVVEARVEFTESVSWPSHNFPAEDFLVSFK